MKIIPKPFVHDHRQDIPPIAALTANPTVLNAVAYQHLVTEHNVDPDRAQQLLAPPRK
jgi:hypothetical protein